MNGLTPTTRRRIIGFAAACLLLGAAGLATTLPHTAPASRLTVIVTLALVGVTLSVAGVVGWLLRPASRVGPLLCLAAVAWLVPYLQDSETDIVASSAYFARDVWLAVLVQIALTYPDGRGTRWTRFLVALAYLRVAPDPVHRTLGW